MSPTLFALAAAAAAATLGLASAQAPWPPEPGPTFPGDYPFVGPTNTSTLFLSAGFTSDMVLKSAPNKAAVYGLVVPSASGVTPAVSVTFQNDAGGAPIVLQAAVDGTSQGRAGSPCTQQCYNLGPTCAVGLSGIDAAPSCVHGCTLATETDGYAQCAAGCAFINGCGGGDANHTWERWQDFSFCGGCASPNAFGDAGASTADCQKGCAFVHNATAAPMAWKVLVPPQQAGGSWTVTVACESGCADSVKFVLERVTFGEVFFCSGQSNQVLGLGDNYDFPRVLADVKSGKYANIRGYQYVPFSQQSHDFPGYSTTAATEDNLGAPWMNVSYMASVRYDGPEDSTKPNYASFRPFSSFESFGAVCFHFAAELTDRLGASAPPIGIIMSWMGGTTAESWSANESLAMCTDINTGMSGMPVSKLFYGQVTPFVNTTLSGWLFYQGENSCGQIMGSPLTNSGYSCVVINMIKSWRRYWSATPGTTAPDAPFGQVTVHPYGCESNPNAAVTRWAQLGNHGRAPNPDMPNVFSAQSFDLGDPWGYAPADGGCAHTPNPAFPARCLPPSPARFDPALVFMYPWILNSSIGCCPNDPLHSRLKSPIGHRLALSYLNLLAGGDPTTHPPTGPTIGGCTLSGSSTITVTFDASVNAEAIRIDAGQDYNMSNWQRNDSPFFMVCHEASGSDPLNLCASASAWVVAVPSAGPANSVVLSFALPAGHESDEVVGLRYGWPLDDLSCCPELDVQNGDTFCPPGACPIKGASTLFPLNPFRANITSAGKCACTPPQVCSE